MKSINFRVSVFENMKGTASLDGTNMQQHVYSARKKLCVNLSGIRQSLLPVLLTMQLTNLKNRVG